MKSLARDPSVWSAVLSNEKVMELARGLQDNGILLNSMFMQLFFPTILNIKQDMLGGWITSWLYFIFCILWVHLDNVMAV